MKILARYLSGIFVKNFLLSVLALSGLYFVQAVLGQSFDSNYPTSQILVYQFLDLPNIVVQMTPPSVLMATVLTLSGLSRTNELIACYSIGISLRWMMGVILSLVFMISCLSLVVHDRILPPLFKKRTLYYWREMKGRQDFYLDVRQDKVWYRSKNHIYNLRSFDPDKKVIQGMTVYTFDENFDLRQVLDAKHAIYTPQGWRLQDGTVTVFADEDHFPYTKKFDEKELEIEEKPVDFQEIEKEVEGLRLKEFYRFIERTKKAGIDTKSYEVKFHARVSLSFIPLVMAILAVPFSIRGRREGGFAKDVGTCLGVTFFYWFFYSIGLSLGSNGALPPWIAAWLPSAVFVCLAIGLLQYRRQY